MPATGPARAVASTIVVASQVSVPSASGASVGMTYTDALTPVTAGALAPIAGARAAAPLAGAPFVIGGPPRRRSGRRPPPRRPCSRAVWHSWGRHYHGPAVSIRPDG